MTDEKAREDFMNDVYNTLDFLPTNNEANRIIDSFDRVTSELEQQPCEDWYDVPSNEMTLEQARQAVKDLRKKLAEYLEQQPCEDAVSRQAVHDLIAELLSDYLHDEDREKIEKLDVKIEDLEPVTPKSKSEYEYDHEVVKAYNDGQAYILDKIRAEVELLGKDYLGCPQPQVVCDDVIKIIDKYRGDIDGKDSD